MPPKKAVGRPKKADTEGTEKQIKNREYMRDYNARIARDIQELSKMEIECNEELKEIKKQKKELEREYKKSLKMLQDANNQAENILKEKTKK